MSHTFTSADVHGNIDYLILILMDKTIIKKKKKRIRQATTLFPLNSLCFQNSEKVSLKKKKKKIVVNEHKISKFHIGLPFIFFFCFFLLLFCVCNKKKVCSPWEKNPMMSS